MGHLTVNIITVYLPKDENDRSGHLAKLLFRETRMQGFMYKAGGQWGESFFNSFKQVQCYYFIQIFKVHRSNVLPLGHTVTSPHHSTWGQF